MNDVDSSLGVTTFLPDDEHAYEVLGQPTALTVVGFELFTAFGMTGTCNVFTTVNVSTALYMSEASAFRPQACPVATSSMQVTTQQGWYRTTFASPISIPANQRFYLAMTSPNDGHCLRDPFSTVNGAPQGNWFIRTIPLPCSSQWALWGGPSGERLKFRVLCQTVPPDPLVADFIALPLAGCEDLDVQFADQSNGSPTTWSWDFENDGIWDIASSNTPNPLHTYTTDGWYSVKMRVWDSTGASSTKIKTSYIQVLDKPTANFTATPLSGCPPLVVQFTDTSTGAHDYWEWDFTDNGTIDSYEQNPLWSYGSSGLKSVRLKVRNTSTGCSNTKTRVDYIDVTSGPIADFTASPLSGCAPLVVQFQDTSTGGHDQWQWDFQDDGIVDSTVQNPSFTYTTSGSKTIRLVVTKSSSGCTTTRIRSNYVNVLAAPVADFDHSAPIGCAPYSISFTDTSTGAPTEWAWDFDNNGSIDSTQRNPTGSIGAACNCSGSQTVKLTVTSANGCSDSTTRTIAWSQTAGIGGATLCGQAPLTVTLTASPSGAGGYAWDFENDGFIDAYGQNQAHTYTVPGEYDVRVVVTNALGCATTRIEPAFVHAIGATPSELPPRVLQYQFNEFSGRHVANTAHFGIAPSFGLVNEQDWQADAGRPQFSWGQPGTGCLGISSYGPVVSTGWPVDIEHSFTFMWWQRMGSTAPQGNGRKYFWVAGATGGGGGGGSGSAACYTDSSQELVVELRSGSNGAGDIDYASATNVQVSPGAWMHVALVVDCEFRTAQWFFNGVRDANSAVIGGTEELSFTYDELLFGGHDIETSSGCSGGGCDKHATKFYDLDDLRIYSEARSAPQIQQDMLGEVDASVPFCSGDGAGTPCPCGNLGKWGHGCSNSAVVEGAQLTAMGAPSLAADSLVLVASDMPATSTALFFQGTTPVAGGAGSTFGDGLRCITSPVVRLGTKASAGGTTAFGGPIGDMPVSLKGLIASPGGTYLYQVWYRDPASYCTAATYNFSNAISVVWIP